MKKTIISLVFLGLSLFILSFGIFLTRMINFKDDKITQIVIPAHVETVNKFGLLHESIIIGIIFGFAICLFISLILNQKNEV